MSTSLAFYSSPTEAFQHQPLDLDVRSIRLLRLLKSVGGPICCEIFQANFDDIDNAVPYEALSYVWGPSYRGFEIEVAGKKLKTTDNLFYALCNLRLPYKDRILWVDAICIDQANLKERGHQVRQMGDIYSKAEQVLFWLGLGDMKTNSTMEALQNLEAVVSKDPQYHHLGLQESKWVDIWQCAQQASFTYLSTTMISHREGLLELLGRPWFERVWILQEVEKARSASICCGGEEVSSRHFPLLPRLLGVEPSQSSQFVLELMPGPFRKISGSGNRNGLYGLLLRVQHAVATDSRDMIYALLGLSAAATMSCDMVPDYDIPNQEFFRRLYQCLFFCDLTHLFAVGGWYQRFRYENGVDLPLRKQMSHFIQQLPLFTSLAIGMQLNGDNNQAVLDILLERQPVVITKHITCSQAMKSPCSGDFDELLRRLGSVQVHDNCRFIHRYQFGRPACSLQILNWELTEDIFFQAVQCHHSTPFIIDFFFLLRPQESTELATRVLGTICDFKSVSGELKKAVSKTWQEWREAKGQANWPSRSAWAVARMIAYVLRNSEGNFQFRASWKESGRLTLWEVFFGLHFDNLDLADGNAEVNKQDGEAFLRRELDFLFPFEGRWHFLMRAPNLPLDQI